MDDLETWLRRHAVYAPDAAREAPMEELWQNYEFTELTNGLQARVFTIGGQPWVMKEGRWDLDFQLFKNFRVPLPAKLADDVWRQFSQTFLPRPEEILRQYGLYLRFAEYLGFFEGENSYYHPDLETMAAAQRHLRDGLADRLHDVANEYDLIITKSIEEILHSPLKYHNFLPKEYLLMGPSFSPANKGQPTFFVFQEFVKGTHLHDLDVHALGEERKRECILFLFLVLALHHEQKLLPDTRPRYPVLQIYDWLTKTDNIISTDQGLKFIDTRWFWETDSNFVKRGFFVPEIMINQTKKLLTELSR